MKANLYERTEKHKLTPDEHYFYLSESEELWRDAPRWKYTDNRLEVLSSLLRWLETRNVKLGNREKWEELCQSRNGL